VISEVIDLLAAALAESCCWTISEATKPSNSGPRNAERRMSGAGIDVERWRTTHEFEPTDQVAATARSH
jgi:hypothetical protein